jgi:hypothetical protein
MASNFPVRAPIGLIGGGLLAVFGIMPVLAGWHALQPPISRFYLGQYVVSYLSGTPIGTVATFFRGSKQHKYRVLVQDGHLLSEPGPETAHRISVHIVEMKSPTAFHAWLREHIYGGRPLFELMRVPVAAWLSFSVLMLSIGGLLDFRRRQRSREGKRMRGPELLSVDEFNRVTKGDGFALYVKN